MIYRIYDCYDSALVEISAERKIVRDHLNRYNKLAGLSFTIAGFVYWMAKEGFEAKFFEPIELGG